MKKKFMLLIFLLFGALICLVACNKANNTEGRTKVVFELEGGTYRNCQLPVVHYYDVKEGETATIKEMQKVSNGQFTRSGYNFAGWYKTKNNNEYSNPWNFDTDKIDKNGVTLYAKWEKAIKYTFNLCYFDTKEIAHVYEVEEGQTFPTYLSDMDVNGRTGYTFLQYVDEDGNAWDMSYAHPGGEQDLAINVYANYLEGDYVLVSSAADLTSIPEGKGVYLLNDIDMKGATLNLYRFTNAVFQGNGHTVSNFKVGYDKSGALITDFEDEYQKALSISIFGSLNGATVRDVTFDNFSVDVDYFNSATDRIYVSVLSGKITNSTLVNVTATNFSHTVTSLPLGWTEENLTVTKDRPAYVTDSASTFENVIITENTSVTID